MVRSCRLLSFGFLGALYVFHVNAQEVQSRSPGFGKTHFIVGMPKSEQQSDIAAVPCAELPHAQAVYFSPHDNIRHKLLELIDQEKRSISIAVYMFTDKKIAHALVDAHRRGVQIEVISDPTCIKDKYNKLGILVEHNIPVYVYEAVAKEGHAIMHHKFAIFGENKEGKSLVWCGSFNFTQSAHARNKESVVLVGDDATVKKFVAEFNQLKLQSVCCKNKLQLAKTMMR